MTSTKTLPRSLDLLDPRLRLICDAHRQAARVPGASIAVVAGDLGYQYSYGIKSILTGERVTAETSFNIGSCSKAFVSAAVASLVAAGEVSWDDPISRYVPEFRLYDPEVTRQVSLRDLSANRLGIPRAGLTELGLDPALPAEFVFENLRHTPPIHPFRNRHTYVNAGHTANAVAVGRITSKGFIGALRARILEPLGMSGTSGGAAARTERADQAGWHCVADGEVVAIDTVFSDQYLGGGGMVVSGADALQWLRLHLGGGIVGGEQVISREALLETHTPQTAARSGKDILSLFHPEAHMGAYALGWAVTDLEGHPMVIHSGGDFGIAAMTLLFPKAGIGIASYCSTSGRGTIALPYALAACLLGLPTRDWKAYFEAASPTAAPTDETATREAPVDLSAYVGVYEHPADGPLVVENSAEVLRCCLNRGYRMAFTAVPAGEHRFAMRFDSPEWRGLMANVRPVLAFTMEEGRATKADWVVEPLHREFHRADPGSIT